MTMTWFPSAFADAGELSRLLYHSALWGAGKGTTVRMNGFGPLQTHVREIGRSPSGSRVEELSRVLGRIPDRGDAVLSMTPLQSSELFGACLRSAPALLELGYPRDEPPSFMTRLPGPGGNPRRTPAQVRSAMHHLGGDFDLMKVLLRSSAATDPALDMVFHTWPPSRSSDGRIRLRLGFRDQAVPAVLELGEPLTGYVLLCCWDLALRLREAEGIMPAVPDFSTFVSRFTV